MASTNKTSHLRLNQWIGSDPVKRTDFNFDNTKIDTAVDARSFVRLAQGALTAPAAALSMDLSNYDLTQYMGLQVWLNPVTTGGAVTVGANGAPAVSLVDLGGDGKQGLILHLMLLSGGMGGWWMAPGVPGTHSGTFQLPVNGAALATLSLNLPCQAGTEWAVYGIAK